MRNILLTCLLALPTLASAHEPFLGTWGTEKQCAREPIKQGGTFRAEPFVIGAEWLKHGQLWCSLNWGPIEDRNGTLFTIAQAKCGEDAVRGYLLRVTQAQDTLTLNWSITLKNGPLMRCSGA